MCTTLPEAADANDLLAVPEDPAAAALMTEHWCPLRYARAA